MSDFNKKLEENFLSSKLDISKKLENFPRFVNRRDLALFLNRYEIYKQIINVHGSIVEGGVNLGAGLFTWFHLISIFEPYNLATRKIIGFDTFEGFPEANIQDKGGAYEDNSIYKEFSANQSYEEMLSNINIQQQNRPFNDKNFIEIIKGDATKTMPQYLKDNKHLLVSLLHIDFDMYEPTKKALETFVPRMSKGAIIAFDEINDPAAVGETLGLLDSMNINNYKLCRNSFDSNLAYIIL
ncbi:MAG: class I SAM-dependent methyltransferase [Campylobacterales bacterium]|nr:class I SAM-dependent methyltransferase [Campylobacterales bacterium]